MGKFLSGIILILFFAGCANMGQSSQASNSHAGSPQMENVAASLTGSAQGKRGVCPACGREWRETQCRRCSAWSPHEDWYVDDSEPSA